MYFISCVSCLINLFELNVFCLMFDSNKTEVIFYNNILIMQLFSGKQKIKPRNNVEQCC